MRNSTVERVPAHTAPEVNQRIRDQTVRNLTRYRDAPPQAIEKRLQELDHEWDIERAIEANAAAVALGGVALGTFVDRRFLVVPAAVSVFLLQHAVQGWCPPVPVLRRMGYRTQREIEAERIALRRMAERGSEIGPGLG